MKKKILIISIAMNVLAGAFILMAFNSKKMNAPDTGSNYLMMSECGNVDPILSITDGDKMFDDIPLHTFSGAEHIKENYKLIARKLNELKGQGYTLVSAYPGNFILEKK